MTTYTGWHFLADPAQLANGGGPVPPVGQSVSIDGEPVLCERGFHASKRALDALKYAPGGWVEKVRLQGVVLVGDDKAVGSRRVSLTAPVNIERELRLFACDCAERALPIYEARHPGDDRPRRAIEVARLYADGKATARELRAANYAANAAADAADAAYYAANAAADAADAAYYAANYATYAANYATYAANCAYYAAANAGARGAYAAATYAANYATYGAADAERVWQERTLSRILREAVR